MNLYPFIEAEEQGQRNIAKACKLFEVSRSAYYLWSKRIVGLREASNTKLRERIKTIHAESKGTYGSPRVHVELAELGIACGRKRVARIMSAEGLVGVSARRYKTTTIADSKADPIVDMVKRAFGPGTIELDRVYVGDITYIRTWEGWWYLATVIDLGSRRVVGWSMADHMRAELACDALEMAIGQRRPDEGLIFHCDRGSQSTSGDFRTLCESSGIIQSMSRKGQCWDNAVAESFFATLKNELIYRSVWATRACVRRAMIDPKRSGNAGQSLAFWPSPRSCQKGSLDMKQACEICVTALILTAVMIFAPEAASASSVERQKSAAEKAADQAIKRFKDTGILTPTDKVAIRKVPALAATIIDPQATSVEAVEGPVENADASSVIAAAAGGCKRVDASIRARTLLGFTAYVFHQVLDWCYNGSQVTSIRERYPYMSETDPNFYYRSLIVNSKSALPANPLYSTMQAKVENCIVRYGCIGTTNPYVQIRAYGSGNYGYTANP